ncbi:condensation domain-containing protein [Streptomyces sp. NBC_00564]|uniref:condensation domain-containing protein n=1 Tax=Streptomyces sp. NBC_00564 TaxID=2903663 RepID=UPI00352D6221|nr:condensation domain-containing protein [Streptomyces sp. NBC_00564]
MTMHHSIRFSGQRTGDAPLTWGQQWLWEEVKKFAPRHEHLNLSEIVDVPEDVSLPEVLTALRKLLEQRESLRTTYSVGPSGEPRQHVPSGGTLDVVERTARTEEARSAAHALAAGLRSVPFSLDDFPIRAGVVTSELRPRHLVIVIFHLATDGWDLRNLLAEIRQSLAAPGEERTVAARIHPLDQSERERGPEGQAVCERSIKYWKKQLINAPADIFSGRSPVPESPRFQEIYVDSEALSVALRDLSLHLKVSPTVIFLALSSICLGRLSGEPMSFFLLGCHNRFSPSDRAATGPLYQDAPLTVDLTGADFREVVRRTWRASLSAYSAAKWNPPLLEAAVKDIVRERGQDVDLSCNAIVILEPHTGLHPSPRPTDAEFIKDLSSRTRKLKMPGTAQDRTGRRFFLRAQNTSHSVITSLRTDTTVLSSEESAQFLEEVEELAVQEFLTISR